MRKTLLTSITLALVLIGLTAPRASAACGPNAGPFCIDGIVTDADNSGISGSAKVVDPNGAAKELGPINGTTTKIGVINTAPTPMLGLTNPNGQVDLNTVYTQTAVDSSTGHVWYYFGWARDSNSGSGFISIELQKSGVPATCTGTGGYGASNCNPWSGRTTGDFIILWDQSGSSNQISIRKFTAGVGFGAPVALDGTTSKAAYSSDLFRGEAAIDFTAVVFPQTGECQSFANTIPGTVTGNSDTADYKDTVLSAFPPVSNCGSVTVTKVTQPAGLSGTFPYTLSTSSGDIFDGTVDSTCASSTDTTQCQATLTSDGDTDTINNLLAKTDTLSEGSVSNFTLVSIVCVLDGVQYPGTGFPVVATKTTACTITNAQVPGYYAVKKVVVNGFGLVHNSEDFCYSLDVSGQNASSACNKTFLANSAADSFQAAVNSQHNVIEPSAGQIAGYTTTYSSECTNGVVHSGATTTCTVTNTAQQNAPAVLTRQRVLLFDRANISNVRRAGDGSDANSMSVIFSVYADAASCSAQTPSLGSETVAVVFGSNTATSVDGIATTGTPPIEIKLDTAGDTGSVPRYWRAKLHQSGTSPANSDFLTPCTEITTVRIQQ